MPQVEIEGKQIWIYENTNTTGIPQITLKITCVSFSLRTETYFRWLLLSTWIHSGGEKWRPEICLCPQAMFPWASNKYYLENT